MPRYRASSSLPALDTFMSDYRAATVQNPLVDRQRAWIVDDAYVVTDVKLWQGMAVLSSIFSDRRGRGAASKVLRELVTLADRHGVIMFLSPKAFGMREGGLSSKQLRDWYGRHGFKRSREYPRDMVRKPSE